MQGILRQILQIEPKKRMGIGPLWDLLEDAAEAEENADLTYAWDVIVNEREPG
jgi:hypothetical protein